MQYLCYLFLWKWKTGTSWLRHQAVFDFIIKLQGDWLETNLDSFMDFFSHCTRESLEIAELFSYFSSGRKSRSKVQWLEVDECFYFKENVIFARSFLNKEKNPNKEERAKIFSSRLLLHLMHFEDLAFVIIELCSIQQIFVLNSWMMSFTG